MKKIKTLFIRGADRFVTPEIEPTAQWVIDGEGVATEKFDGTCCLIRDGKLYKRYDKKHPDKPAPEGWEACEPEADPYTGHHPGWLPVDENNPADKWHVEGFNNWKEIKQLCDLTEVEGTYELIGPNVQRNLYDLKEHVLFKHGAMTNKGILNPPRDFEGLKNYFSIPQIGYLEGIVWHRDNGDMVKIKYKDFFTK